MLLPALIFAALFASSSGLPASIFVYVSDQYSSEPLDGVNSTVCCNSGFSTHGASIKPATELVLGLVNGSAAFSDVELVVSYQNSAMEWAEKCPCEDRVSAGEAVSWAIRNVTEMLNSANLAPMVYIGAGGDEETQAIAKILSEFNVATIGYDSISDSLSDKTRFPSFFRLSPKMSDYAGAMTSAMSYFSWNDVDQLALVVTNDVYGDEGKTALVSGISGNVEVIIYEIGSESDVNSTLERWVFGRFRFGA